MITIFCLIKSDLDQIIKMWLGSLRSSVCFSLKYTVSLFANSASLKSYSCYLGEFHLPKGYDTGIMVYNSSANRKVPLVLKNKGIATWYMCGPTVYDESHIGHACCYVKFDILRRIMEKLFGISVLLQMGITDIDDKIIKKAQESDLSTLDVARKYELEFFKGMAAMGVMPPSSVTRVTENIPHMISFCEKLIEKDVAYVTSEGNVYFKISKAVSAEVLNELPQDSDINLDPLKEDGRDFALWKIVKEDEPYWISPWGKGRPGWHIECSVMASKIFGCHLDLHSGGYDLLFPHHSNEKSQSEAYHNCSQWGNYWLHSGLLQVGNEIKMSKSIKNTVSIKEFLREHSTNDFRILCLQSPYRKNILYCSKTVFGAKRLYQKFHNFINEMELYSNGEISVPFIDEDKLLSRLQSTKDQVISLLADDFNTSQAILCLTNLIDSVNESLQSSNHSFVFKNDVTVLSACASYIDRMLEIFGVNVMCKKKLSRSFVHFMDAVNEFRNKIRLFALYQIDISQISRPADYIENNYTSFQQRINLIDDMKID
ncbi:probable cysteine--tRNA ligase, mitochondrial isoform X4 [Argiope bruennichi]|uniref:probable cysteine--tRNA ligase, mitochondrial isoform X4 n=1 Tax=Argiope bruennichi TaxID=94029 RepID=UPI002493DEE1|nr:probable cysteine--tRNA ligase, mitochondrial isoform X4 [Argiope bruennichi]